MLMKGRRRRSGRRGDLYTCVAATYPKLHSLGPLRDALISYSLQLHLRYSSPLSMDAISGSIDSQMGANGSVSFESSFAASMDDLVSDGMHNPFALARSYLSVANVIIVTSRGQLSTANVPLFSDYTRPRPMLFTLYKRAV